MKPKFKPYPKTIDYRIGKTKVPTASSTVNIKSNWNGKAFFAATIQQLEQRLEEVLKLCTRKAKTKAPVDTGHLRDSIRYWEPEMVGDKLIGSFGVPREYRGVDMKYGLFQEVGFMHVGSGRIIRNPYLQPALWESRPEIVGIFSQPWTF